MDGITSLQWVVLGAMLLIAVVGLRHARYALEFAIILVALALLAVALVLVATPAPIWRLYGGV